MKENSLNCPYCGSVHVHKNPRKLISSKRNFIVFNVIFFPFLTFLCWIGGKMEQLPDGIIAGIIGETIGIIILYFIRKKTYSCDDCKSEF